VAGAELDPAPIFEALARNGVRYTLIGGLAGIAHGSAIATFDIDIAYAREPVNIGRLAAALGELEVTLRGAPPDLPFRPDPETLAAGLNFTFDTPSGPLDAFGEPTGAPPYAELEAAATEVDVAGVTVRIASLEHLIRMKRAAGRPKDLLMASEYEALAEEGLRE
jgi:hypothetical protein